MPRPPSPAALLLAALALAGLARPATAFTPDEAKAPMTVTLVHSEAATCGGDCPEWLALTGKIGFETPGRLAAALARLGKRRLPVMLDSPGGESLAGLAMGRTIRAHGLDTAVATTTLVPCGAADAPCRARERAGERDGHLGPAPGSAYAPVCASACVLVLAGGVDRAVPPGAFVGVHQAKRILTFHPVMNTFRVLSRIVNGRKVEVSRTLVATRAMPVRVVTEAAPQSVYDQFERTLIGLGVDESIVPLMRATPPSGIHWMTAAELASTRIGTDTAAAATLVAREAEARATAARVRDDRLDAALTLDDGRRWTGIVVWRIDPRAQGTPTLVGDWELPFGHLRGSIAVKADAAPASASSFRLDARFARDRGVDAAKVFTIFAPRLCYQLECTSRLVGPAVFDAPSAAFSVPRDQRTSFLADLHQRDWLVFTIRTDEGRGSLALTLSDAVSNAIAEWERLCCSFAAADWAWAAPATSLPGFPAHPEASLIRGVEPVHPVTLGKTMAPRTLDMRALYNAAPLQEHGFPAAVRGGSMTWFPIAAEKTNRPGASTLLGSAELPTVGLRVSIDIGPSRAGILGRLTARLHILTDDPSTFGPMGTIFGFHAYDERGHPLLMVDGIEPAQTLQARDVHIDIPETGPIAGAFQIGFEDVRGRRVTLAFPFDPAVAGVLQAASRQSFGAGS